MRELARTFKALSDETRLEILALLLHEGELCVCDIERALDVTQSKASRHLRYLRGAGLVDDRRHAAWVHYHVAPASAQAAALIDLTRALVPSAALAASRERLARWREEKRRRAEMDHRPEREAS